MKNPFKKPVYWFALQTSELKISEREPQPSKALYDSYERIYRRDAIAFAAVNYLVHRIVNGLEFVGKKEEVERVKEWAKQVNLQHMMEDLVRDVIVYGTGWIEIIPSRTKPPKIRIVDPKKCDFLRDLEGKVEIDEFGDPKGIVIETTKKEYVIYKDRIEASGEVIKTSKVEDLRKRYPNFTLYSFGDSFTGISFLEPILTSVIIRGNIEKMTGELAYRAGGVVAYVEGTLPEEVKKKLLDDLTNMNKRNVFVMSKKIELKSAPIPEFQETSALLSHLINEQCAAMGIPYEFLLAPVYRGRQSDLTTKIIDFEGRIVAYQRRLEEQINSKIMPFVNKYFKTNVKFRFVRTDYNIKLLFARVLAGLARRGLITYDESLENYIRKEMGIPMKGELDEVE